MSWFTLETLAITIGSAKADSSVARTIAKICRSDIIVVDDISLLPVSYETTAWPKPSSAKASCP
ncbi:hypothetical protein [Nonomuraea sp. NPDC049158]|uniref:hypothetical protein n=1 Tax=Nonomuraea sp. NPDC049158 TaxID=3155649 RepID=UPI0033FACBE6